MRNAMWVGGGITGMGEIPMLGVKEKGIAKVIRDIFRNGEKGFFYDPSDMEAMYQDAAGSTAVSASGQPLGIVLDKSKGLVLGSDLRESVRIINTGGITKQGDHTYRVVSSEEIQSFSYTEIPVGAVEIDYEILGTPTGSLRIDSSTISTFIPATAGRRKVINYNTRGSVAFVRNVTPTDVTVKVHSVRMVLGNHAYQSTTAARPILQQTPVLGNELIVNGNFNNGLTGWSNTANWWSSVNGRAYHPFTSSYYELRQSIANAVGKLVEVTFDLEVLQGTAVVGVSGDTNITKLYGVGKASYKFTQTLNAASIFFAARASGLNSEFYIDNISIKEITGYRKDQNYLAFDGVDDKLLTNLPTPLVNATVLRAIPNVGTQVKYNQTLPLLHEDSTNHSGLIAIDRALTRQEQLRLMTELDKKAGSTSLETLTFKAFDDNQEGFVYDPNDLSTMFQDAAGTVPVTEAGQPVGLLLDKSKGLMLGAELVTNGSFNNGLDGWVGNSSVTFNKDTTIFNNGGAKITVNDPASTHFFTNLGSNFVVGKSYLVSADVYTPATNTVDVVAAIGFVASGLTNKTVMQKNTNVVERISMVFVATSTSHTIYCSIAKKDARSWGDVGDVAHFDNISVREVKGNHAYQTTSASRPILRKNAITGANYLEFDGIDDRLTTSSFPSMGKATTLFVGSLGNRIGTSAIAGRSVGGYLYQSVSSAAIQSVSNYVGVPVVGKSVITAKYAASGAGVTLKVNDVTSTNSLTTDRGYSTSSPLTIGAFNGEGVVPFGGHIYSLIGIAKVVSDDESAAIEKELAKRTGVTLNV